jgi:hypothetical protein
MIIEFNKKQNFYDDLENKFYGIDSPSSVIYNFIPVKILDEYYILTSSKDIESYLIEYRQNITVKLYIDDTVKFFKINSVISFSEKNYNPSKKYDCYIDSIGNLVLIKFKFDNFNYIEIDNHLCPHTDIMENKQDILLTYIWTGNNLKNYKITKNSQIKFVWENKYINLPEIPYILDNPNINKKLNPTTGSAVFNVDNFLGMVTYINDNEIIITPLITIKKIAKYLEGEIILSLGLDLYPVSFNFKSELNKINFDNGLLVANNFYDNYKKKINKSKKKLKNNYICSNNFNNSNIYDQKQSEPDQKLIKEYSNDNIDQIKINNVKKNFDNSLNEFKKKFEKRFENLSGSGSGSGLEYKKNIKELENDKNKQNGMTNIISDKLSDLDYNINLQIKKIILDRENKKCLSKKNILCSVDNFKINSYGQIIISDNKIIPFKSYLWLFKSFDNNILDLYVIPNYVYTINLIELNNGKIILTDSYVKKKLSIIKTKIYLDTNYDSISSFDSSEIKYVKYKDKFLLELNEKILITMKKILINKPYLYQDIFEKIFSNRYNHYDDKIIMGINFENEYPRLTILNNCKNFKHLLKKYKTKKELKRFITANI